MRYRHGFGESSRIEGLSCAPQEQAARLEELRAARRIEAMHLAANAMGGI